MKKLLFALTALAMIAVSCKDIQETDFMKITQLTLTASTEQPVGTRTMVAGAGEVFWEKGDEIKVFAGTASGRFISDVESGLASTALFTGSLGGAWTTGSPLWAVYPFSDEAVLEGETLTAELPAVQTARSMSFAQNMNLSVARTTTASFQFYNVGGGVCFTLTESGIRKVVFEGLDGEILAGKVKIAFQEDRPVVQEVVEGSTTVTLAAPEGQTLEGDGVWYYIVALPGTLEKGFKLSFYKGNTVAQKTFAKTVTVKRSIYGEVRNADEGASYIPDSDENIAFKDAKVKSIVVRYFDTGKDGELSYKEAAAVQSFFVDEALTRADGDKVSVFAGTDIETFDEIIYFTGLTKIEDGAFAGCTQLTSITIPETITEIGANAFKGCTGLQSITILSETPPTIGEGAFADTNDCPIIVPAGTTETYVAAWGEYAPRIEGGQPDNEIWYTTSSGDVFAPNSSNDFGAQIVSNTYENGKGVIAFDGPVSRIGKESFAGYAAPQGNNGLTSIKLPNSVKSLGYLCFGYCAELEEVSLPAGITEMEEYVFFYCKSLKSIEVPAGIKRIELGTFRECTSLSSVILPDGLVTIGVQAFQSCTSLTSLEIPETVTEIGAKAFSTCQVLTGITIPRGVTLIDNNAFQGCRALTEISIDGATVIDTSAFSSCRGLTSVLLSEKVVSVGERAFSSCSGLTEITSLALVPPPGGESMFNNTNDCPIYVPAGSVEAYKAAEYWSEYADRIQALEPEPQPDNEIWYTSTDGQVVTSKTQAALFGATLVSNEYADGKGVITFDGAVTQIGDNAFRDCRNLASIQLPMSVTRLGQWAFMLCNNLVDIQIPASVTLIDECAIQGCESLVNIQIPESVSQIGNNAFNACTSLESIAIPASVIQIGTEAFGQVWSCTSIVVDPDNPVYDSRNDCNAIIETASNTLIAGCKTTVIPASVEILGKRSFFGCRGLVNLTIPSSVTQIGDYAFSECTDLVSATIPSSVTQIGYCAFRRCYALTSMTVLSEMPPQLATGAFQSCDKCIFYVPAGSVEAYKTAQGWSEYADRIQAIGSEPQPNNEIWYTSTDGQVIQPSAVDVFGANIKSNDYIDGKGVITFDGPVSSVGSRAFFRNDNLTEISLPEGVKYLGEMAFFRNRNLTSVTLPNSLDSIASRAFASCIKLSGIKIPSGVRSIGMSAFMNCPEITAITIPDGITRLEASVFAGTGITEIAIPEGVVSIGNNAFQDCSRLVRISLPESLVTIDGLAFQRCTALPSLKIPKSVKSIGSLAFLNCLGLKELSVDPGNSVFDSRDLCNAIIETASNTLRFGCSSTIIPGTVTIIGENAFMGSGLGRIDIPASVKTIGNQAFSECASLTSLTIPSGVLTIGRSVISNCPNLGSVVVADGNPRYDSRDQCNAIIETASNTLIAGCRISTIPSGISELGASAFTSCTGLTRIDIPAGVKIIGDAAFSNCSSLEEVSMPDGVVSIGHSAFSSCTALTGITLPASLTCLDQFSFYLCDALASVTALSVTPPTGSSSMFYGSNCPIYVPAASVEAYKAAAYWSDYADRIQAIP